MAAISFTQKKGSLVFGLCWLLLFIIYFPAAKAGFTADFTGWLQNLQNDSFADYLNRKHHSSKSLYQFTQLSTYLFYKIWGTTAWMWHLLHITLHAINCLLFYKLMSRLFKDAGIKNDLPVIITCLLYAVNPHVTEVIVWEPAYHFLTGVMFILLILLMVQQYHHHQKAKFVCAAAGLFFISSFSLELFYLTPFFVLSLAVYYYIAISKDKTLFRKTLLLFLLPQILVLGIYFVTLKLLYNESVAHINAQVFQQDLSVYFYKMPKYLFHILFFGRFWPDEWRSQVYYWCSLPRYLFLFYGVLLLLIDYIFFRLNRMEAKAKIISLLFFWIIICFTILFPIWFQDILLSVCDRYTYLVMPALYLCLILFTSHIPFRWIFIAAWGIYMVINIYFTHSLISQWQESSSLINHLIDTSPKNDGKIKIFLNQPQSLNGIAMMTIGEGSEIQLMKNLLRDNKLTDTCFDAAAFNMTTIHDGANARFVNDSTVKVIMNQWGCWWWYGNIGMTNYENKYYRVNVIDGNHEYDLILKHPRDKYGIYYIARKEWLIVSRNNNY